MRSTARNRRQFLAALTGLSLLCSGCTLDLAGDRCNILSSAEARETQPRIAWPHRDTSGLDDMVAQTPEAVYLFRPSDKPLPADAPARLQRSVRRPLATVHYNQRLGVGVLRELANRTDPPHHQDNALRFVSVSHFPIKPRDERGSPWRWFLRGQAELGAPYSAVVNEREVISVLGQGLRMRIIEPPDGVTARGLIVHMPGLGSRRYEEPVLQRLRADGWVLLQVATPRVWFYEPVEFTVRSQADVETVGADVASVIDDQLAEPAYAVEAALAYLASERPDVPTHPCVMLGFSAGALFAPAVVARQPDAFDAAILVGGGTNLLQISQTSDLTNGGLKINWPIASDRERLGPDLAAAYARYSQLDPLNTAPALAGMPALLVLAALDSTVSAPSGDRLHRLIPNADRRIMTVGHRLMFWLLDREADAIAAWLDRATAKPATPPE